MLALLQSICALVAAGRARCQVDHDRLQLELATGQRLRFGREGIKRLTDNTVAANASRLGTHAPRRRSSSASARGRQLPR